MTDESFGVDKVKFIEIEEALNKDLHFIDVRSPQEFKEDTIPGAVNVPLLDDDERRQVGIVYKNEGSDQAKLLGLRLIAHRLPQLVEEISKWPSPAVFCWRGGLRSKSVVTLLNLMGVDAYMVQGGYKSYRSIVMGYLDSDAVEEPKYVMLHGLTGVGKTEILQELVSLGENVLDFEGMANHRGSVFGSIGLGSQPGQKAFESKIVDTLRRIDINKPVFVECESRRVGKLLIPEKLFQRVQAGKPVLVIDSVEGRTRRILKEYMSNPDTELKDFAEAIQHLEKRLGWRKVEQLTDSLSRGEYSEIVEYLLLEYYDPLYGYPDSPSEEYFLTVENKDAVETAIYIKEFFNNKQDGGSCLGGTW